MKVKKFAKHKQHNTSAHHGLTNRHKKCKLRKISLLNACPGTAKLEHHLAKKDKPRLKRLKKYAKPVTVNPENSFSKEEKDKTTSGGFTHVHTNGDTELEGSSNSEDFQEWNAYANSVLQNGTESPTDTDQVDKDGLQYHAQLDHTQNRAVLVMQQNQVHLIRDFNFFIIYHRLPDLCLMSAQTLCFRGKCLLTCLYGRVEVLGFTIEEGQQPYQLFSPPSHCPLTITALGNNSSSNKNKKEGRLEAKAVVRKYLPLGIIM